jgi:hypothetical protein
MVYRMPSCSPSKLVAAAAGAVWLIASHAPVQASQPLTSRIPPFEQVPKGDPSFFVTSRGIDGGNLGGLAGADAHCASLAREAGLPGAGWRAYLSTQATANAPAVNARDRIGKGPWFNVQRIRIATDLAHLHGDTVELARAGNLVSQASALTERGDRIGGKGDAVLRHDILTGSRADGRAYDNNSFDRTCRNWTYSGPDGSAQIGHSDRDTVGLSISWNSAHQTTGCSRADLKATGGDGLFYCFASKPDQASKQAATMDRSAGARHA